MVAPSLGHVVPMLADASFTRAEVTFIAIVCAVFLVVAALAHGVAALLLVPDRTLGRVAAATLLNAIVGVMAIFSELMTESLTGPKGSIGVKIAVFCVFVVLMMGIYRINVGRAIGYTMLASVIFNVTLILVDRVVMHEGGIMAQKARIQERMSAESSATEITQNFASLQEAQAAAVRRYPELGKAGSPFNQRFLQKHAAYKAKNDPILGSLDWPMKIAAEVAGELAAR